MSGTLEKDQTQMDGGTQPLAAGGPGGTSPGTLSREAIRNKIFSAKPVVEKVEFFGTELELRQPTLGTILDWRQVEVQEASFNMLLNFAYVPGTDEKVFEPTDEEIVKQLPFGDDMQRLISAVNKLLGLGSEGLDKLIADAMKNAGGGSAPDNVDEGGVRAGEE